MSTARRCVALGALALSLLSYPSRAVGAPVISEFLAANQGGLEDESGNTPDWIELHNPGSESVNLDGWHLTDAAADLTRWRFPATNLPAGGYLVIFASGDDRKIPGLPLHTNFRLSDEGEYLALVGTNGVEVVSAFAPAFRAQFPNISFGLSPATTVTLLAPDSPVRARVPENGAEGTAWRWPSYADGSWASGTGGVGYETSPADYAGLLGLDLRESLFGQNTSVYVRAPFTVERPDELTSLRLLMQYDDGFVAWINGQEVARRNAPAALAGTPQPAAIIRMDWRSCRRRLT